MIQAVWHETLQVSKCPRFGFFETWEWWNYVTSKRHELVIQWHSFTPQKTWNHTYTDVETANLSHEFQHWGHRTKYNGAYHDGCGFPFRHPFLHYSATSRGPIQPARRGFHYKILTRLYHNIRLKRMARRLDGNTGKTVELKCNGWRELQIVNT